MGRRAAEQPRHRLMLGVVIGVKVVAVNDDRRVDFEGKDGDFTLWHHDVAGLQSTPHVGGCAEWKPRLGVPGWRRVACSALRRWTAEEKARLSKLDEEFGADRPRRGGMTAPAAD